jgi:hypothetical protein
MRTKSTRRRRLRSAAVAIAGLMAISWGAQALAAVTIERAHWDGRTLTVSGSGENRDTVTLINANDPNQVLGTREIGRRRACEDPRLATQSGSLRSGRVGPGPRARDPGGAKRPW